MKRTLMIVAASAMAATCATGLALAQTPGASGMPTNTSMPGGQNAIVTQIDTTGQALVRGVLQSMQGNTLAIQSWGGVWTVTVTPNAQITPNNPQAFRPGDIVGVIGQVQQSGNWALTATVVRDWSQTGLPGGQTMPQGQNPGMGMPGAQGMPSGYPGLQGSQGYPGIGGQQGSGAPTGSLYPGIQGNIYGQGTSPVSQGSAQLYQGRATQVLGNAVAIQTSSGAKYTISVGPNTTVWNSARKSVPLSNYKVGDTIRTDGVLSGMTIQASVIRDTSI